MANCSSYDGQYPSRKVDDSVWGKFDDQLDRLLNDPLKPSIDPYYCKLHHVVRQLVSQMGAARVFERLETTLTKNLLTRYSEEMVKVPSGDQLTLGRLWTYERKWTEWESQRKQLDTGFKYLDHICEHKPKCYSLIELTLKLWKGLVMTGEFRDRMCADGLKLVENHRNGFENRIDFIPKVISAFVKSELLEFDQRFLRDTDEFYKMKTGNFLQSNSVGDYMAMVQRSWEEEQLLTRTLHSSTQQELKKLYRRVFIQDHIQVFRQEFRKLLADNLPDDVKRMNWLFDLLTCDPDPEIVGSFQKHVVLRGSAAVERAGGDPKLYFTAVWAVYRQYANEVEMVFNSDAAYVTAFKNACTEFINTNAVTTAAELLAKYCDLLLRRGTDNGDKSDRQMELGRVALISGFIRDADVFQVLYQRLMANRLVAQRSLCEQLEEFAIDELSKIDRLGRGEERRTLKEIRAGQEFSDRFKCHLAATTGSLEFKFDAQLLPLTSVWTLGQTLPLLLPPEMQHGVESLTQFYSQKFKGRKLHWLHHKSKGQLRTHCFSQTYTITASTYQMVVLLRYNVAKVWTVEALAESTGIQMELLLSVLDVLVGTKMLMSDEAGVQTTSKLSLNTDYSNEERRVNINFRVKTEQKEKVQVLLSQQQVEQERKHSIQAAIVRILKKQPRMDYADLETQTIDALSAHFKPSVASIERAISILIEKEYIHRDPVDINTYNYIP